MNPGMVCSLQQQRAVDHHITDICTKYSASRPAKPILLPHAHNPISQAPYPTRAVRGGPHPPHPTRRRLPTSGILSCDFVSRRTSKVVAVMEAKKFQALAGQFAAGTMSDKEKLTLVEVRRAPPGTGRANNLKKTKKL